MIVFFTEPPGTVLPKIPRRGVYAVHDPEMKHLSQLLYVASPRAAMVRDGKVTEVDQNQQDLNTWIEKRIQ